MVQLHYFGNNALLERDKTAFLCSHRAPTDIFPALKRWIGTLRPDEDCVVCGCLSGFERWVIQQCVERQIALVIVLAERLPDTIEEIALKLQGIRFSDMMGAGKLLFASVNDDNGENAASQRNAELRNRWMLNISKTIVIGYAQAGGRLETQIIGVRNVKRLLPAEEPDLSAEESFKRGWAIYHYLCDNVLNMPSHEIRAKLLAFLQLKLSAPSPLHSALLFFVTKEHQHIGTEFNFPAFFEMWGPQNLREEDWERRKSKRDTYYDAIAEKALHLLEMAPEEFRKTELTRRMAAEALKRYPRNSHYRELANPSA